MTRFWPLCGATLIATSPCPIFLGLPLTAGASAFFILSQSRGAAGMVRRPFSSSVRRMQTVHKIRTRGAQHFFDLLDRLPNHAARLAGLNLAFQLKEPPIGAVETLCQYGCHAKERDRVYPKYGGRIGDMKLRGFKRTYIGRVRLIQQHESSPNTAPGSVTLAISTPSFTTATAPSLRISSRPVVEAALSTVSPAW